MRSSFWRLFGHETDQAESPSKCSAETGIEMESTAQQTTKSSEGRSARIYRPRHAARDALLSIPVTTREYIHLTGCQQQVWSEIGFSSATQHSYNTSSRTGQASQTQAQRRIAASSLKNGDGTYVVYGSRPLKQHRMPSVLGDVTTSLKPDTYEGKGKGRAVDVQDEAEQNGSSGRQDSAVMVCHRQQSHETDHLPPVNEDDAHIDQTFLSPDDYDLLAYFDQEQDGDDRSQDQETQNVIAGPATTVAEKRQLASPERTPASSNAINSTADRRKSNVKDFSTTSIPRLQPRRYFSHSKQSKDMPPLHKRVPSDITDSTHRSSTTSQSTVNHDAYASSVTQSATASTAPTIAESDEDGASRTCKE